MDEESFKEALVDCEKGRQLGCATFCCRLIVRYSEGDDIPSTEAGQLKSCVDKDLTDGLCVHIDRDTHRCTIWDKRPKICREYSCNDDHNLQIVLRHGFTGVVDMVLNEEQVPKDKWKRIPLVDVANSM